MKHLLVCYDIPDDSTRKEVGELLEEFGTRVQRSVFEIRCGAKELENLQKALSRLIDPEADSIRFYAQCAECRAKGKELGNFADPFDQKAVYYF